MSDDNKVVFLKKAPDRKKTPIEEIAPDAESEPIVVLTCGTCHNKTWALLYSGDSFPKLQCVICGQSHGHMGWIDHDK